jgi:hypothetical protein
MRKKLETLHNRWGQPQGGKASFDAFKSRLLRLLDANFEWPGYKAETAGLFFFLTGFDNAYLGLRFHVVEKARELSALLLNLQQFVWALEEHGTSEQIDVFIAAVRQAVDFSPGIDFAISRRKKKVTFYPAGAGELDTLLVGETLTWLYEYPKVAEHVEAALQILLAGDTSKYRNALDNLRLALEQLLRSILGNKKTLEKQREILLPWLGRRGVHPLISGMYADLLAKFAEYQNEVVKHPGRGVHDVSIWQKEEMEFLVYLTGAFMRFIIQMKNSPETVR